MAFMHRYIHRLQDGVERLRAADSAAELDRHVHGVRHPPENFEMRGDALEGAVQIDQMEALRTQLGPVKRRLYRVFAVDNFLVATALYQPHAFSAL